MGSTSRPSRALPIAAACAALALASGAATAGPPRFRETAAQWGLDFRHRHGGFGERYLMETMGSGVVVFDYDGDGDPDVLFVDSGAVPGFPGEPPRPRLYRNDGGRFVDVSVAAGIESRAYGMGGVAGDVDGDGVLDLYLTGYGPDQLLRNRGDGSFRDATAASGVVEPAWSTGATLTDVDRDGDLDLYVVNYVEYGYDQHYFCGDRERRIRVYCPPVPFTAAPDHLYRNRGDGTFDDVTAAAGIRDPTGKGLGVVAADLDGDLWPELYVSNDTTPNLLFHNRGGTFTETGVQAGVAYDGEGDAEAGMGIAVGDVDGNGRPDLVVTNFEMETNAVYGNLGGLLFTDLRFLSRLAEPSLRMVGFGVALEDFDRDGDLDVFVANGHIADNLEAIGQSTPYRQRNQVFENQGGGRYREVLDAGVDVVRSSRGLAVGDLDGDFDLDVVVSNSNDTAEVYENLSAGGAGLRVALLATRSPAGGVGARVAAAAGSRRQTGEVRTATSYLSQSEAWLTFGWGETAGPVELQVDWPSGARQRLRAVPLGRAVVVVEPGG